MVRLGVGAEVPAWAESSSIFSVTVTATETSLVCAARSVPTKARHERGFIAFEVQGPLDLALAGVLVSLLAPLAEEEISVVHAVDVRHRLDPRPAERRGAGGRGLATTRPHGHRRRPRQEATLTLQKESVMTITHPAGFRAAGVAAGLKSTGAKDLALVVNDGPRHDSASVFTANRCKANPILWSQEVVKDGVVRAVVLNSGGANCYTGADGFQTTHSVAERVAERVGSRSRRRGRLLDRPDRPGQLARRPADRGRRGRRRPRSRRAATMRPRRS